MQTKDLSKYLGKKIHAIVDRPIGSSHPEYNETLYPINYGYIPNTVSGDGKEIDCYIVGADKPLNEFNGICIAIVRRNNDIEQKLVLAPIDQLFTKEEIINNIHFIEKYFDSEVLM